MGFEFVFGWPPDCKVMGLLDADGAGGSARLGVLHSFPPEILLKGLPGLPMKKTR